MSRSDHRHQRGSLGCRQRDRGRHPRGRLGAGQGHGRWLELLGQWADLHLHPSDCHRQCDGSPKQAPPITVKAAVGPSVPDGTTLINTATVSTSTPGDSLSNNTGTADVPVVAIADLVLKKSVQALPDGETLDAGEQVTYDLLVTNEWKSDAVAPIKVMDTLPAGFTYAGTAGTGWGCSAVPGPHRPPRGRRHMHPRCRHESGSPACRCHRAAAVPAGEHRPDGD